VPSPEELRAARRDADDLAVLDVLDLAGVGQEGGHRGGEERLELSATDDERALLAGAHEDVGLGGGHRDEREVALELGVGGEHGVQQRARRQVVGDEVGDDLGVRLAREARPAVAEGLAQRQVVLHDAVDHDVHAVRRVEVGVGVGLVDAPVRRPAGVADARGRLLRGDRHAAPLRLEAWIAASRRSRFPTARTASIRPSARTEIPAES
jgi:hypothetical protein